MVNISIHIDNYDEFFDENVFVLAQLPCVPQIGSIIHLTDEIETELERKATFGKTKEKYFPKWYYGTVPEKFEDLNSNNCVSFTDAIIVKKVLYIPNSDIVKISLGD